VDDVIAAARRIRDSRYADAAAVLAAGSIIRGEASAYSDLDMVVIYPHIAYAYRESFRFEGFPVEAFVHDPETLKYFFFEVDRRRGIPALPQMVFEGVEIPGPSDVSRSAKELAASVLSMGPPLLTPKEIDTLRYGITDLIDDMRDPKSREDLIGAASHLFESLADYYLRSRGLWTGNGKGISRALRRADPELCTRYCEAFEDVFTKGDVGRVISLATEMLKPNGGLLWDGFRLDAPPDWRVAAQSS